MHRLITEYGDTAAAQVNVRFLIGPDQKRSKPGKAPKEVDRFKRKWKELADFGRVYNWRQILDNDYPTRNYNDPMTFMMDGIEWRTVTHFLLGMLYINSPEYALTYSLADRDNQNGYWGDVKYAMENHLKNIESGKYAPDPNFQSNFDQYLMKALLAKFTQNPIAKKALLLTEDAILSRIRTGEMVDLPIHMQVRQFISQTPNRVYRGDTVEVVEEELEMPILISSEQLNVSVNPIERPVSDVLKEIGVPYIEIDEESIQESECTVYILVGIYNVDILEIVEQHVDGDITALKYVKRHLYGVERFADNIKSKLMIGVQREAVSQTSEYIALDVIIDIASDIRGTLYFQPYVDGFAVFVVSANKDDRIREFLETLPKN